MHVSDMSLFIFMQLIKKSMLHAFFNNLIYLVMQFLILTYFRNALLSNAHNIRIPYNNELLNMIRHACAVHQMLFINICILLKKKITECLLQKKYYLLGAHNFYRNEHQQQLLKSEV